MKNRVPFNYNSSVKSELSYFENKLAIKLLKFLKIFQYLEIKNKNSNV